MSALEAIKFDKQKIELSILNQLLIPYKTEFISVKDINDGFDVIKKMQVRGAPAIAIVGCFSVVVELHTALQSSGVVSLGESGEAIYDLEDLEAFKKTLQDRIAYLIESRPTAVNLLNGCNEILELVSAATGTKELYKQIEEFAIKLFEDDLVNNFKLSENGLNYIYESLAKENFTGPFSVLTICNTGSLATSGRGTALGIIRSLWEASKLNTSSSRSTRASEDDKFWLSHVYATETRPYNQGSRLTSFELDYEKVPFSLITDNMVSFLLESLSRGMQNRNLPDPAPVKFIIVGADRIVSNGDLANKIGTFQLSLLANHYPSVKFIGAAPRTTIDLSKSSGDQIVIEQRPQAELTTVMGAVVSDNADEVDLRRVRLAPVGISTWNPSFDVTPHEYIDCIVTEEAAIEKDSNGNFELSN